MEKYSPIVLFVYNRPWHTQKTLDALALNAESIESVLYIFCDGLKELASYEQLKMIAEVRTIARLETRFKEIIIIEQKKNLGLSNSIIEGVTSVVNEKGRIIVLEDDHVTSPFFLKFMNDALTIYENDKTVACISAYIYPVNRELPQSFFIRGADCWGWATWRRAWNVFEPDGRQLLKELNEKNLCSQFDFENSYGYTQMLRDQIAGKNNSWAIRWYASAFLKNLFCLYPGCSLIQNIGFDGSGTHSGISDNWKVNLQTTPIDLLPITIEENIFARQAIRDYFMRIKSGIKSIFHQVLKKISSFFK